MNPSDVPLSEDLHVLLEARLLDDYQRLDPVPLAESIAMVPVAERFVESVRSYLTSSGPTPEA